MQNAVADGDTRTITMHHLHTNENITITFKRNGRYDEAALSKLNWFLRDWRENKQTRMDPHLIDLMWDVYREVDGSQPIQIICGYRDEHTNSMLRRRSNGVAQHSLHMRGMAMDFMIPGVPLEKLRVVGLRLQRGGVGYYPSSGSPFVHMDVGGVRHWPRMTREQLVRVFPNGRTVHIPSDGKPLKGYALALADIGQRGGSPSGMSLAAARNAGVDTATTAPHKRSLLASIFGSNAEDEDETKAAAPVRAPVQVAVAMPKALAAPVPLPKTRPSPAPIVVAMAVPPAEPPASDKLAALQAQVTPNDIIRTRGYWVGRPDVTPAGAPASRHLAARMAAAHGTDPMTTGGIIPAGWLSSSAGAGDQRLAYAAQPERYATSRRAQRRSVVIRSAAPATSIAVKATARPVAKPTPMLDPWLNAVAMTPSVRTYLSATQYGVRDFGSLEPFLNKPATTVVMAFSGDPHHGLRADRFSGRAVVFLGTMTFAAWSSDEPSRTALLN